MYLKELSEETIFENYIAHWPFIIDKIVLAFLTPTEKTQLKAFHSRFYAENRISSLQDYMLPVQVTQSYLLKLTAAINSNRQQVLEL